MRQEGSYQPESNRVYLPFQRGVSMHLLVTLLLRVKEGDNAGRAAVQGGRSYQLEWNRVYLPFQRGARLHLLALAEGALREPILLLPGVRLGHAGRAPVLALIRLCLAAALAAPPTLCSACHWLCSC